MEVITLLQGNEESSLTPFFMVHAISGIALPFLRLDSLGDNDRPVYGITNHIHCPGNEDFEYPSSLDELAKIYLREIQEIQPRGPYLLGGWSMGGMIAMFMAQILQSRGEEVLKVIMIDSANPEAFPTFCDAEEHKAFAKATYTKISRTLNGEEPVECIQETVIDEERRGSGFSTVSRQSTWSSTDSGEGFRSRASSVFDFYSPETGPGTPASLPCSSDDVSVCGSDDEDMHKEDLWGDYDDDTDLLGDLFLNINLHVHQGIGLIAGVTPGDLFQPETRSDFDVLLVKCRSEPLDAHHREHEHDASGAEFVQSVMREKCMRWDESRFRSFESVAFSGDHDGAFEPQYVGELSMILRVGLDGIR